MTTNQTERVSDEELDQMIWKLERDGMTPKQLSLMRELREVRRAKGDGRDQFEEWFKFHHGEEGSIVTLHRANGGANYADPHVDLAWIAWKDSRAAMLQGADCKPELTVWYGAMPETNGKTNWTAILHRKGECLSTGITIDRSEHPDRVRYEADRMRHLIGELADKPDILAYDAEAHSGYVYPGNSPATPDGWIPVSERMPDRDYVLAADISGAYYPPHLPNTQVGIYADWFGDGKPSWDDGDGNDLHLKQVTHWMPLPEPPMK